MSCFVQVIVVPLIVLGAGQARGAVELVFEAPDAEPGARVRVTASLDNPNDAVRGLQFTMTADPPVVSLAGFRTTGRTTGGANTWQADAAAQADGSIRAILFSQSAARITEGSGPVLSLDLDIDGGASAPAVDLVVTDLRVAGGIPGGIEVDLPASAERLTIALVTPGPPPTPTTPSGGGGGGGGCALSDSAEPARELLVVGLLALLGLRMRRHRI